MDSSNRLVIWGNYFGFMVMGMIVVSFGATMPFIRESYKLSYEQGGVLLAIFSGSYLVNGLLGGVISDRIGLKKTIVIGNVLYVAGLTIMAFTPVEYGLYLGILITGMGWGFCNTGINVLIGIASNGDGNAMSLLHMSFGIGAFIIPLIFSLFLELTLSWKHMMLFLAAMALVALILSLKMEDLRESREETVSTKGRIGQKSLPFILLFGMTLFFYVGSENTFSNWMVTHLTNELRFSQTVSQNLLSTFWLMVIVGRVIVGRVSRYTKAHYMVVVMGIGGLLGMFMFVNVSTIWGIAMAIVLCGLMFSGIYPMTMVATRYVVGYSATISALIISGGGLGSTILPYITGKLADNWGTAIIFKTVLITLGIMVVLIVLNAILIQNNQKKRLNQLQ